MVGFGAPLAEAGTAGIIGGTVGSLTRLFRAGKRLRRVIWRRRVTDSAGTCGRAISVFSILNLLISLAFLLVTLTREKGSSGAAGRQCDEQKNEV